MHPVTLRFASSPDEAAFLSDYTERSVVLVRLGLLVGLVQYALFGLMDPLMMPGHYQTIWSLRVVGCVALALAIAWTYAPAYRRHMQASLTVPPLIIGLLITSFAVVAPNDQSYDYYVGIILVLSYVHVLLRLRFVVATAINVVLFAVFLVVRAVMGTDGVLILNEATFLFAASATGMVASYALERYARTEFLHARQLDRSNRELGQALDDLHEAQDRLVQNEKMASLGRLTSGVAHEIKNPLNFVSNFAGLNVDLADELQAALAEDDAETVAEVANDLRVNSDKIAVHSARADAIVRAMQEHTGARQGARRVVGLNDLVEEHARSAHDVFGNGADPDAPRLDLDLDPAVTGVHASPVDLGRVVGTMVDNALYAARQRAAMAEGDGAAAPAVVVRTRRGESGVTIEVEDNGSGIPADVVQRVFEPFYTTKPPGEGTGLGLSLAYQVVEGHEGTIDLHTEEGVGTRFTVVLQEAG